MVNEYTVGFRAPALPYPPKEYDPIEINKFNNVLRLYFNQLDNTLRDTSISNRSEAQGWFFS